jgi:hypothetical protein
MLDLKMNLHRSAAYQKLAYFLRSGPILTMVRFNVGLKRVDLTTKTFPPVMSESNVVVGVLDIQLHFSYVWLNPKRVLINNRV